MGWDLGMSWQRERDRRLVNSFCAVSKSGYSERNVKSTDPERRVIMGTDKI
jgi:hypothetical protein